MRFGNRLIIAAFSLVILITCSGIAAASIEKAAEAYERAWQLFNDHDNLAAIEQAERAVALHPENCRYQYLLGFLISTQIRFAEPQKKAEVALRSLKHMERSAELCPDSLDFIQTLIQYHLNAPAAADGDKGEAWRLAGSMLAVDSAYGLRAQAEVAKKTEQYALAETLFTKVLDMSEDPLSVKLSLAEMYSGEMGRYDEAYELYKEVYQKDPFLRETLYHMGRILIQDSTDARKAVKHLQLYMAEVPTDEEPPTFLAFYRLGQAYEQLGIADSARICYRESLKLNPQFKPASDAWNALTH
jgi:tetratricopeptide (TPR) repeat protein